MGVGFVVRVVIRVVMVVGIVRFGLRIISSMG